MSTPTPSTAARSFERLIAAIGHTHAELAAQAARAVNASLTLRNWLIGLHIAEYEQQGTDRAQYGENLLDRLSDRLIQAGISRAEARELRRYRQFYLTYPRFGGRVARIAWTAPAVERCRQHPGVTDSQIGHRR